MTSTFIQEQTGSQGPAKVQVPPPATSPQGARPKLRKADDTVPLPWDSIGRYLSGQGMRLELERPPRQFAGGLANLNYLVDIDGREYVLRRPPLGEVLPGANDMAREHRVLQALAPHYRYAPRAVLYCADTAVMGAHFQIMEYRAGRVIGGAHIPPDIVAPAIGQQLANSMVDLLVQLHALDPVATGLGDLGKPEGFLARAVTGWTRRAELASENQPHRAIRFISAWLEKHRPPELPPTLLHADFKLDNLILHPQTLEPVALLDWDMSTRGDPLFDLATLLSYWTEAGDPPAMHELGQMPTAGYGFPTRFEVVQAYARATGRDVSNLAFYRVLCIFKLSVVFMQLHARYRSGATTDPRYSRFGELSRGLLEFTHDLAQGRHA
ncbi:phosphotransferase family protein [Hydrogenophaga sp.]|uniref:phosphotransferase family protein n=1 Tax=Hydrogenophaga sp. TaxID=1904254 RepID=UPI00356AD161